MRFMSFPGPASKYRGRCRGYAWIAQLILPGALLSGTAGLTAVAQNQPPPRPQKPLLLPEANRPPDANEQMRMRETQNRKRNFEAANVERLKQMMQATQMMETMAIALKAEIDNSASSALSPEVIRKAETIEKLAHIVQERMKMTVAAN